MKTFLEQFIFTHFLPRIMPLNPRKTMRKETMYERKLTNLSAIVSFTLIRVRCLNGLTILYEKSLPNSILLAVQQSVRFIWPTFSILFVDFFMSNPFLSSNPVRNEHERIAFVSSVDDRLHNVMNG